MFIVYYRICAAGKNAGRNTGAVAEMACGEHIRRTEKIGEPVNYRFVLSSGAVPQDYGFRPKGIPVTEQPLSDGIQRLIPGDPFPLAAAFRAQALHRMGQPVGVIGQLG